MRIYLLDMEGNYTCVSTMIWFLKWDLKMILATDIEMWIGNISKGTIIRWGATDNKRLLR